MLFICYPPCGTCKKARAWLDENGKSYTFRDIKMDRPSESEIKSFWDQSGLPLKSFFNTSGLKYKSLSLKVKLPMMSEEEQLALLASDGLLVKRPILVDDGFVLVGFKKVEWEKRLKRIK